MCHSFHEGAVSERKCMLKENIITYTLFTFFPSVCLQMAAKMGGDQMPNMNSSPPVIDPSLYGFGGQKRSLDNGGKPSVQICIMFWYIDILTAITSDALAFILHFIYADTFMKTPSCYIKAVSVFPLTVEKCLLPLQSVCVCAPLCQVLLQPPSFHFIIQSDMLPFMFGKGCYFVLTNQTQVTYSASFSLTRMLQQWLPGPVTFFKSFSCRWKKYTNLKVISVTQHTTCAAASLSASLCHFQSCFSGWLPMLNLILQSSDWLFLQAGKQPLSITLHLF